MATSLVVSLLSLPVIDGRESTYNATLLPKSSFIANIKLIFAAGGPHPRNSLGRRSFRFPVVTNYSFDRVPKQFSEENLADGLMDNFKNVPPALYGLNPSQMGMFMTENNAFSRQSEQVTEESISSAYRYCKMSSISRMYKASPPKPSMSMYDDDGDDGYDDDDDDDGYDDDDDDGYDDDDDDDEEDRGTPPDLPSHLLAGRIVWIGMPLVPAVTELLVAELMWLNYDNPEKPIYLYIHSSGTQNERQKVVGAETDAYAIADMIGLCKARVYTLNMGMAYGQAAMLLSLGTKGFRNVMANSSTKLYLPQINGSGGDTSNMWFMAKEMQADTETYLDFLEKGIGKPKEEIRRDIEYCKFFMAQDAIDYGIADRILKKAEMHGGKSSPSRLATSILDRAMPQAHSDEEAQPQAHSDEKAQFV